MKQALRIISLSLVIITILLNSIPFTIHAQDELVHIENVQLWIYPEYDDPRLLVMLEGRLAGVEPPQKMEFMVPSTAEMYSAGSMDSQGRYSGGPPDRTPSGIPGWDIIGYEVTTDTFRVEYYDSVIFGYPDKSISYEFRTLYEVLNMEVIVQEPLNSTGYMISPEGSRFIDSEGFSSYLFNFNDLKVDSPLQFDISYYRTEKNPSLSTVETSTVETDKSDNTLVIIIFVVILLAIVVAWLIWKKKSAPKTRAERRRAIKQSRQSVREDNLPDPRFCSQCGNPLDGKYKYCPNCGVQIK